MPQSKRGQVWTIKAFRVPRALRLVFCAVLLTLSILRLAFHLQVLGSPLLRVAFLAAWGGWALALLHAGRSETDPEWRRYDRGAAIMAAVVLAFDLMWPNGWGYLKPGTVATSISGPLLGIASWTKPTTRSGAEKDRDASA